MVVQVMKVIDRVLSEAVEGKQVLIQGGGLRLASVGLAGSPSALPEAAGPSSRIGQGSGNCGGDHSPSHLNRSLS